MRIFTLLLLCGFAVGTISAAKKPMFHDLVLPEGFAETKATDGWGYALISSKRVREWRNEAGISIRLSMDNSMRSTNTELAVNARHFLRQAREQYFADYDIVGPVRYTVGGKEWICVPVKAKDPGKNGNFMLLITEFDRMLAVIQMGGWATLWEESKRLAAEILELNSPK